MMRILHVTAIKSLIQKSGIPVVLKELTKAQNEIEDIEARVLSINAKVDNVDSPYFINMHYTSINKFLKSYNPDVAIFHSFFHKEYAWLGVIFDYCHIPYYIEPHGSFGKEAMKKSRLKKELANATIFSPLLKNAIGFIFTNQSEYNNSIYRTNSDLIIPNGVSLNIVEKSKQKAKESYENPIFYYLGRFDIHHKGLDYLFDAMDILNTMDESITIRFYGTGSQDQEEYVNDRIRRLKKIHAFNCGTIYGHEKKVALECCNILVLTSRYEGSPMTVLDGLSYGNPCVVTPGTNVADEIVKNNLGWKTEINAEDIAKALLLAKHEYAFKGKEYYINCKKYVLDKYQWNKIGSYSIECLKSIVVSG